MLACELPRRYPSGSGTRLDVTVVTQTPTSPGDRTGAGAQPVVRHPGALGLWRLVGKADVILLVGPALLPIIFALLRSKLVVVTHHGYQTICPNGLLFHLPSQSCCPGHYQGKRYLECVRCCAKASSLAGSIRQVMLTFPRRAVCRLVRHNVSVSEHLANRLQLPSSLVIRNGVPRTQFPDFTRVPVSPPRFLYVGRMVVEKGVKILVEAASILQKRGYDFRLLLLGDGPQRSTLEKLSRELGLQKEVAFAGFKTGPHFQEMLNEPAISVIPSIWEDVAPFSPLEQMMAGKAIICSDIGGLAEEVGGAGLTFPPGNATALSEQMLKAAFSPELAVSLGKAGRERACKQYTSEEMILRYEELLRSSSANHWKKH